MRSINAARQGQESEMDSASILKELKRYSKLKNTVVFLWCSLFFMHGVVSSGSLTHGIAPYSVRLVESITPVNGTISCLFMMLCGAGDFFIVFVNGELIQKYGAMIQPAAISIY